MGGGLYLKALAFGIDTVLNDYRQSLVKLEQKVTLSIRKVSQVL